MVKRVLYILILFFMFVCYTASSFAADNFIIKEVVSDDAGKLILINGTNLHNADNLKIIKLSNPDRAVLDIPNSILAGKRRSIDITDSAINNVKIGQFSVYPEVVRIVFTASNRESLDQIKINKSHNSIIIKLNSVETPETKSLPIYQDKDFNKTESESQLSNVPVINLGNVMPVKNNHLSPVPTVDQNIFDLIINNVRFKNNHLTLSGTGTLALKEPYMLQNPSRLVFDLPNATFSAISVPRTFTFNNGDILKIGQLDPQTVRVMIDTKNPDNYKSIISPDLQTLIITPKDTINIAELPNSKVASQVQKIDVRKIDLKETKVTINATGAIIHHIKRLYYPDKLKLELYNVNAPNKSAIANLPRTEQFQGVSIDYIEKYPNGASWTFPLNKSTKVESNLSLDGKTIELTFKDVFSIKPVNYTNFTKGKVVIDAGHGGDEPGAQRENIFEKNITLDVAKKVKNYLNQAGINVVMTRSGDETVSLKQRTIITSNEDPSAFVSVHVNSCNSPSVTGLETHWYTPQSKKLAQTIQNKIIASVNSPDRGIQNSMFYVIHHTDVPAVLVEIGFISNDKERNDLLTPERQEITARAIAEGIIKFLESKSSN